MKPLLLIILLATLLPLTSCSSKKDASDENFRAAINMYLTKNGLQCFYPGKFPVDLTENSVKRQSKDAKRMAALQAAGLVSAKKTEVKDKSLFSKHVRVVPVIRYTPTDTAKPYLKVGGNFAITATRLCWATLSVDEIKEWEKPLTIQGITTTRVTYTAKPENIAEWAHNKDIQAAFPGIKKTLDSKEPELRKMDLILSDDGWVPQSMVHGPARNM